MGRIRVQYRYFQIEPDEHGRSVAWHPEIDADRASVLVYTGTVEAPADADPIRVLNAIAYHHHTETNPARPRGPEIRSLVPGDVVELRTVQDSEDGVRRMSEPTYWRPERWSGFRAPVPAEALRLRDNVTLREGVVVPLHCAAFPLSHPSVQDSLSDAEIIL